MNRCKSILPFTALIFVFSLSNFAYAQSNITGKWTVEFDSQVGHQKYIYDLKVDGNKLTGKAHRQVEDDVRDTEITEGKVNGEELSFVEVLKNDDQDLRIEYKGKLVNGELHLTRAVGDFATSDIIVKRMKDSTTQPSTQTAIPSEKPLATP